MKNPAAALALLLIITVSSLGAQDIPPPYDPSNMGEWSDPISSDPETRLVIDSDGGVVYVRFYTTTRSRSGTLCDGLGPMQCGGGGDVPAGTEVQFPGGLIIELKRGYTFSPVEDPCWLCNIFACANVVETEIVEHRDIVNPDGHLILPRSTTRTVIVPDPDSAVIKQECDKSDEAREFCCPEIASADDVVEEPESYAVNWGDLELTVSQLAFGPQSIADPGAMDLFEIGAVIPYELGESENDDYPIDGEQVKLFYSADSLSQLSLGNRVHIQENVLRVAEEIGFGGRILVSFGDGSSTRTFVDLGTVDQLLNEDTLYLDQPADVDMDGLVDQDDLDIVLGDLGAGLFMARGDLDLDGSVDGDDVAIVLAAMGD